MSLFDSVYVTCPSCGRANEFQSKGGACMMIEYTFDSAPEEVLIDTQPEECRNCGVVYRLVPDKPKRPWRVALGPVPKGPTSLQDRRQPLDPHPGAPERPEFDPTANQELLDGMWPGESAGVKVTHTTWGQVIKDATATNEIVKAPSGAVYTMYPDEARDLWDAISQVMTKHGRTVKGAQIEPHIHNGHITIRVFCVPKIAPDPEPFIFP